MVDAKWLLGIGIASTFLLQACSTPKVEETKRTRSAKIVGGTQTTTTEWPGIVQLESQPGRPFCGASLVAPGWVLTAAHCVVEDTQGLTVVVGRERPAQQTGQAIPVAKVNVHPSYNDQNSDNDIALLQLAQPAPAASLKAKVVSTTDFTGVDKAGTNLTVAGWGATSEGGQQSQYLQQVSVPLVTQANCNNAYQGAITNNMFCAGLPQGGKDSCQGDSGGPIYAVINGAKVQVGVVSWGNGCARANNPGVYTRVANYGAWLKSTSGGAVDPNAAPVTPTPETPPAPPVPEEPEIEVGPTPTPTQTTPAKEETKRDSEEDDDSADVEDADDSDDEGDDEVVAKSKTKSGNKLDGSTQAAACQASPVKSGSTLAVMIGLSLLAVGRRRRKNA